MIYNDALSSIYSGTEPVSLGASPIPTRPTPTALDYANGYITRAFAKKVNEDIVVEISNQQISGLNADLYAAVKITWTITGPKYDKYNGKVIDQSGVIKQNQFEISRVMKEAGINLGKILSNPLEFWRGY